MQFVQPGSTKGQSHLSQHCTYPSKQWCDNEGHIIFDKHATEKQSKMQDQSLCYTQPNAFLNGEIAYDNVFL